MIRDLPKHRPIIKYLNKLIDSESKGKMFFLTVSGAHMYGFTSRNSDIDYRGVYIASTDSLSGILPPHDMIGPKMRGTNDIELFEVRKFLALLLKMNNSMWEWLYSDKTMIYKSREFIELRELVEPMMSKDGLYHSYGGTAHNNYDDFIKNGRDYSVKKFLYVIRSAIAGIYVLNEKKIEVDINTLNKYYGHDKILEQLISLKKRGLEKDQLDPHTKTAENAHKLVDKVFIELEEAYKHSNLPSEVTVEDYHKVNSWLKKIRRNDTLNRNSNNIMT